MNRSENVSEKRPPIENGPRSANARRHSAKQYSISERMTKQITGTRRTHSTTSPPDRCDPSTSTLFLPMQDDQSDATPALNFDDIAAGSDEFGPVIVQRILDWCTEAGATDLHLLPTPGNSLTVLARIEGVLQEIGRIPDGGARVVARLKVLARLLTYKSDVPQEGRLALDDAESGPRSARLATCPTVHGEKAILRFFRVDESLKTVPDLALPSRVEIEWQEALAAPQGLLLVSGPAGSGKTTTAYASLRTIIQRSTTPRAVVSLEDPVEQILEGVAQTAVAGTTGLTFADGLRAVLRHDPEILLVGELRDRDTIETAVRAALTGHLVIATIHTGSAAEAVVRLFDAGIEPFLILSGLVGVLHQRLVTDVAGNRFPIAELLRLDTPDVRNAVRSQQSAEQIEHAATTAGMETVRSLADLLQEDNRIDRREFVRLFGPTAKQ